MPVADDQADVLEVLRWLLAAVVHTFTGGVFDDDATIIVAALTQED